MMIATFIVLAANTHTEHSPKIVSALFVSLVSLFLVTYFISIHGDLAEGILVSVFVEERLNGINGFQQGGKAVINRPGEMVKNLYNDDTNEIYNKATIVEYLKAKLNNEEQRSA